MNGKKGFFTERCCSGLLGLLGASVVLVGCNSGDAGATKPPAEAGTPSVTAPSAGGKTAKPKGDTTSRREHQKQTGQSN
jgi:hypothetical protein